MENRSNVLTVALILFVATVMLYARSVFFPFAPIDDHVYVTKNYAVLSGLSVRSIKWAFTTFHGANWHPLTWLSLMCDAELFGKNPMGYHLHNVVLHGINTSLLFLVVAAATGALWRSAFVAACFAVHPMHVESVAWITERKDVLSTLFFLAALLAYTRYAQQAKQSMYLTSLAAFALSLMAKPMMVTFPVLLLLWDIWPLGRMAWPALRLTAHADTDGTPHRGAALPSFRRVVLEKVPFLLLAAASSLVTFYAQGQGGAIAELDRLPFSIRSYNALSSTLEYLKKLFLPLDLAVYYPYTLVPAPNAVLPALLILALSGFVLWRRAESAYLATGWFWFMVTLLPVIGLVQVGSQAMADRYTYIPYTGLFIMLGWGGAELAGKVGLPARVIGVAAGVLVLASGVLTWDRLGYWRDNERLIQHTISVTRNNWFAHSVLGSVYEMQGKADRALAHYQEALRINPGNKSKVATFRMGVILLGQGKPEEALERFDEVVRQNPRNAEARFYRGVILEKLNRVEEALSAYREAAEIAPEVSLNHTNLGALLARTGRLDEAILHFSKALELNPNDRKARENLQLALRLKGNQNP
jgi:tetratricopeptide (TPR) repeat protein